MDLYCGMRKNQAMYREWLAVQLRKRGRGSTKELAEHLGLEPSAISRIVSGARKMSAEEFFKTVRFFGGTKAFPPDYARQIELEAENLPLPEDWGWTSQEIVGLPIAGEVAAGMWIEPEEIDEPRVEQFFVPPDPRYPVSSQRVWVIKGNSVERVARDGQALVCVLLDAIEPKDGDIVIAQRIREQGGLIERTAKRLRINKKHAELVPEYFDEKKNEPLPMLTAEERGGVDPEVVVIAVAVGVYLPLRR